MSKIKVNEIEPRSGTTVTVGTTGNNVRSGGNNLQAADGGNLISQCGTTITLGASGDTINLASGASQSGFGRTGTVDWCTTAKTTGFTVANGKGYFVNTTGGAITVTLPASPTVGDIFALSDYANTWGCNAVTLCRNTKLINGGANNTNLEGTGEAITMIYVDVTRGWKQINDATIDVTGAPNYISATGGAAVVTCGDYKTHIFTGSGCFAVATAPTPANNTVDYFVVGGGGSNTIPYSGGGGAGGFRVSNSFSLPVASPLANPTGLTASASTTYPITVGGGGSAPSGSGSPSIFSSVTSAGGGYGGSNQSGTMTGANGGSGGGGRSAGSGNSPPVSPPQGNGGGSSPTSVNAQGGGGGAAVAGGTGGPSPTNPGSGGSGSYLGDGFVGPTAPSYGQPGPVSNSRYFAGGGGGGSDTVAGSSNAGLGGGGDQRPPAPAGDKAGQTNMGGGAGGTPGGCFAGGSGIVMIRYKYQ